MPKAPGKCCFCGRIGLSKEHIWPEWAHAYLPDDKSGHHRSKFDGPVLTDHLRRQGSTTTIKIRAACEKCNNGWMSVIEDQIKGLLLPIIKGETVDLNADYKLALTRYFLLKAMIADLSRPEDVVFNIEDRVAFYKTRTLPTGLSVTIFHYPAPINQIAQYNKEVRRGIDRETESIVTIGGNFTFRFASVFVQVLLLRQPNNDITPNEFLSVRLHPSEQTSRQWPPSNALSFQEAYVVQHALAAMLNF